MALRIEIKKNWKGLYEIRFGDLSGSNNSSNISYEDVVDEIKDKLLEMEYD